MKKYIFNSLLIGGCLFGLSNCDDNSWNNHLDGFESETPITDVQSLEYTLTAQDYANIAANSTNKKMAQNDGLDKELSAVGTQKYFTEIISAQKYVPAFLSDPNFPYFTLSDGSSIKVTYNVATNLPNEITEIANASLYTVDSNAYMNAWGSDTDYIEAYTPSHPASKFVPRILSEEYADAEAGEYVIVSYNYSEQEPVFGSVPDQPETPTFTLSDVIGTVAEGSTYDINGVVTAICSAGYIITDNSGSIFVYFGNSFDINSVAIGDQLTINGTIGSYNKGLQITGSSAIVEKVGNQNYTYPTPVVYDGADFDALLSRENPELAIYAQFTGTVTINGNYTNFIIDGAETAQASPYYATEEIKAALVDGNKTTITGYYISISGGRYCNFIITNVATANNMPKKVASVASKSLNAVYYFDGSKWSEPKDVTILNPDDYSAMGQTYENLSGTGPQFYLPKFLSQKFPYAQAEDAKFVVYKYYGGGETNYVCDQYIFDGAEWIKNNGVIEESAQFVKNNGNWIYNPNVTITLPAGKNQELSTLYFQACTNWVFENIDKPLGSTGIKSGMFYVTSYGNNEYYSGTSAYQGNVDLRPSAARTQYPAAYENMTDEEVVNTMKKRFCEEVMPGALSVLHPDATPVEGIDVIYTINFAVYTGSTSEYTVRYKVVDNAKFEFIDCTWD